jgi:hypothetical protein
MEHKKNDKWAILENQTPSSPFGFLSVKIYSSLWGYMFFL